MGKKKSEAIIDYYYLEDCDMDTSVREAYRRGYRRGCKKSQVQPKQGVWILCEDRMPRVNVKVLVSQSKGVTRAKWDGTGWKSSYQTPYLKTVDAWMPMPDKLEVTK